MLPDATVTANAYLGGWGIATALDAGAQVVVTGRVTDAALVIGPAAWWHGWDRENYDALAGALVAGHVLECGAQATGGNYSFFTEVPGIDHVGFPLAEIEADGSSTITKPEASGGLVDVGTVTAQLLYEIQGPLYLNPDVSADFTSIQLEQQGPDRVRISGVRGEPPPATTKICVNTLGGFRNSMTFLLTGLDIDAKADLVRRQLAGPLADVEQVSWTLAHTEHEDPETNEKAVARLTVSVKDSDGSRIGRPFSGAAVEIALASYPGCTLTSPPGEAAPYGVYQAAYLPNSLVEHRVVLEDGTTREVPVTTPTGSPAEPSRTRGVRRGLGTDAAVTARSGRRRPQWRQGRQRQPRRVGTQRRRVRLARQDVERATFQRAAAGNGRPERAALPVSQPAGDQLRRGRAAR
jgi:hypothetical protein